EKFFDINCRYGGVAPPCPGLGVTHRARKKHGGVRGAGVKAPGVRALPPGFSNMEKHPPKNAQVQQPYVGAGKHLPSDTTQELDTLQKHCEAMGLKAIVSRGFSEGGQGCVQLAEVVRDQVASREPGFRPLYDWNASIEDKIRTIAKEMYGAQAVDYTARAKRDREQLEKLGFGRLPVCIAKTQQSLSDNPALLGRPKDFLVTVREIQLAAGAGFVIPITGEILRMPGLPREPLASRFDLADDGEIVKR